MWLDSHQQQIAVIFFIYDCACVCVFYVYVHAYLLNQNRFPMYQAYLTQDLKSWPCLSLRPQTTVSTLAAIRRTTYARVPTSSTRPLLPAPRDASYLPPLASLPHLRCENPWDPPDAHTCTICTSGGADVPRGRPFTRETKALRSRSSPLLI